jgi:DeoR/GlpR family transcriptional regulator of sugar metabolism
MATKTEIDQRGQRILEELLKTGTITVEQVCKEFNVSVATARRDLENLEQLGRLRRTHGGAISLEPLLYEPFRHVSSYNDQVKQCADEKRRIALAAAELINDGDIIALTAGTTTTQITRAIAPGKNITVVTNTINVAMELSNRPDISVFVTGGFLHGGWFSLVGNAAIEALRRIFVDKAFIGANGLDSEHGATAYHPHEADLNSILVRQAKERIVVVDHTKLGVIATHLFCPVETINLIITDKAASDEAIDGFLDKGIKVQRV